jgi:alpha-tubulin suppressor-like RCC1 family protein
MMRLLSIACAALLVDLLGCGGGSANSTGAGGVGGSTDEGATSSSASPSSSTGSVGGAGQGGMSAGGGGSGGALMPGVSRVGVGPVSACSLDAHHVVHCWGSNESGQLGDGHAADSSTPVAVDGSDWTSISVGGTFACALKPGGDRFCWGDNSFGEFGDGTLHNANAPVATDSGWASISAGSDFACGLHPDGTLWCWGSNDQHQVDSTNQQVIKLPIEPMPGTQWLTVASGLQESCGAKQDGSIWCWGIDSKTAKRMGQLDGFGYIAMGFHHRCAIQGSGELYCWGQNDGGQLGTGDRTAHAEPTRIGSDADWARVSAGLASTCAIKKSGALFCWGSNPEGELGVADLSTQEVDEPTEVLAGSTWLDVWTGGGGLELGLGGNTCGVQSDGSTWCWGLTDIGLIGNGDTAAYALPPRRIGTDSDWVELGHNPWGLKSDGSIHSWGMRGLYYDFATNPPNDQIDYGVYGLVDVFPFGSNAAPGIGKATDCYLKLDGTTWCISGVDCPTHPSGIFGCPFTVSQFGTDQNWSKIFGGPTSHCGIRTDGSLACWGKNDEGQIGDGTMTDRPDPTPVLPGTSWLDASVSGDMTCGITSTHLLYCWGDNIYGGLGNGPESSLVPVQVGTDSDWATVDGEDEICTATKIDGSLWGWGRISGDGSGTTQSTPVQIDAGPVLQLSNLGSTACYVKQDGTLWCWGVDYNGEAGVKPTQQVDLFQAPVQVGTETDWAGVSVGENETTCGLKSDGSVWCWGDRNDAATDDLDLVGTPLRILSP